MIILAEAPDVRIETFEEPLDPRHGRCLADVQENLARFMKLGALQSVDRGNTWGIRWISAIGRFYRTRGDGWPRTGGQVKHEGKTDGVQNSRTERYTQARSNSKQCLTIGRRLFVSRSTSIYSPRPRRVNV